MRPPTNPSDWTPAADYQRQINANNWTFFCGAKTPLGKGYTTCRAEAYWTLSPTYRQYLQVNKAPAPKAWWLCKKHVVDALKPNREPRTDAIDAVRELLATLGV